MANVSSSNGLEKYPKLRFKGFSEPWETDTLGNLGTFIKGAPLSKADITDEGTPFVLYGELYTTYGEVTHSIKRRTDKVVEPQFYSKVGDVIMPTSGETPEDIATASCIMLPDVVLAGDLLIYRTQKVDGRLVSFVVKNKVNKQISSVAQGKSVVHVRAEELSKISISYPSDAEQQKILTMLELLEDKMAKQRELIEHLKKYKRGASEKIFSEADGWDHVGFLDIFSTVPDKPYQVTTSEYYDSGIYEVVDQGKNDVVGYNNDESKVFNAVPIIVYGDHTTIIKYRKTPFIVGGDGVKLLTTKTKNNLQYLYYALCQYNIQPEGYKRHFSIIKNLDIPIPSIEKQQIIAETLATLDMKIQKESCLLEKLLKQKKAFLQQLFI